MRSAVVRIFFVAGLALTQTIHPRTVCAQITAFWANSGDDKVAQDEQRATSGSTRTISRAWDGETIQLFGARNEVVSFNLVLESTAGASELSVSFDVLASSAAEFLRGAPAVGNEVFDWTRRQIELFYVRYLPIRGLSLIANATYDERLIPYRFRRPWTKDLFSPRASGHGQWSDRPDHDRPYPEIAVPLEFHPRFNIPPHSNQSIWADIYIPKRSAPGLYRGTVEVRQRGRSIRAVPVQLRVHAFTLPDMPSAKTMLYYTASDISKRFLGNAFPDFNTPEEKKARLIRDRYFMLAHRHRISLIGDVPGSDCADLGDQPCPEWTPRLDGSLFSSANGYAGPGENTGNNVYSIGTYGAWNWKKSVREDLWRHADNWVDWFTRNSPSTEYFLFLIDESPDIAQIEQWAQWIFNNPGKGRQLRSFATMALPTAASRAPTLDIVASTIGHGVAAQWEGLSARYTRDLRKRFFMYNGHRPASGSFATEDDGVALRELAWGQYKKGINRWFYWHSTYYNDYQGAAGDTDLFQQARTYGGKPSVKQPNLYGQTSATYGNGDGVLMYPGTDKMYPKSSYDVNGPLASLRLKYWRRGIQDVDYLTLAAIRDPAAVKKIVNQMIPKVLWEVGVYNASDPTFQYTDISWTPNADAWEDARLSLAKIIERP
ncbi:MAG: hypothetical protein AAB036_06650 [Elusimicrobiota bacterium]